MGDQKQRIMQSLKEEEDVGGVGMNTENISTNHYNPEENNELNYKWICETCTYQNWMAAKCCAMCLSKRNQIEQVISENNVNQSSSVRLVARKLSTPTIAEAANSDIFKLGKPGSPPPSTIGSSPPINSPLRKVHSRSSSPAPNNNKAYYLAQQHPHQHSGAAAVSSYEGVYLDHNEQYQLKWSCAQCTYLNLSKYPKCIQCLSSRKKISPTVSRNSPVSPRTAFTCNNSFSDSSTQQNVFHGNKSTNNQHISPSYRPQSTSPPPKTVHNLGNTFDSMRINANEDSIKNNERNRNNGSPPHSQIQCKNYGKQEKKSQYQIQNKDKNIFLQSHNRVVSPPIISAAVTSCSTTASTTSSSPPPPLASCNQASKKWICQACTYENWPKSVQCVICGTRGGNFSFLPENKRQSPPPEAGSSSQYENTSKNVRPGGQSSNTRDNNTQISPSLPSREVHALRSFTQAEILTSAASTTSNQHNNNCDYERRLLQLRRRLREADWSWLSACLGVAEGDMNPVEGYLNSGGDPTRKLLTAEVALLNRPDSFSAGHTLVHLAIKFHREDMLATLLSQFDGGRGTGPASAVKCVPSYVAPDLASAIRRHFSNQIRQRKGHFPCNYICEWATYSLPSEIEDLPPGTQEQLYSELMDRDAQKELEEDVEGHSGCLTQGNNDQSLNSAINWSVEIRGRLGSRLYALWNRSAGDCLLDSVLQATWGVFDRDNTLRRAMAESLHEAGQIFYPRWKEWEIQQALELDYTLDESQLTEDWAEILSLASQPGASLEQIHIFCLAHVLRRPIIVYGVKYVKSWRGENLGYARFEGVYLPLLWEPSFCTRSPIALGYTRGHFCALVPPEPVSAGTVGHGSGAGALLGASDPEYSNTIFRFNATNTVPNSTNNMALQQQGDEDVKSNYLPLVTSDRKQFLPIYYLNQDEMGNSESILRQWLDVRVTDSGIIVAKQNQLKPPLLVEQLTEEWLNHYRKLAQTSIAPLNMRSGMNNQQYNYNNSMGCNNPITSNHNATAQSNITRSTIRRMSPTMCTQHNNSVASSTSSIPASSSTTTSTLENVIPVQGITNSIMSGSVGGGSSISKGATNSKSPSNQVCYSSDGDSDEE